MAAARAACKQLSSAAKPLVASPCRPIAPTFRSYAKRPGQIAQFVENSLLTDLMPLLMPSSTALQRVTGPSSVERLRNIITDVLERDHEYEIKCDLPGLSKESIKVDHHNDVLNISVEQKRENDEEKEEAGVVVHRMERSSSYAKRSMRLPDHADFDSISAKYDDGVLTVRVPKKDKFTTEKRVLIE